jgi:LPXTG-motif cell wall-anchored protein
LIPADFAGRARVPLQADPCPPLVSATTGLAHTGSTSRGVALAMGGAMLIVAGSSFVLTRRRPPLPR